MRIRVAVSVGLLLMSVAPVLAAPMTFFDEVLNTDYSFFSVGGMRDVGTAPLVVSGLSGTITRAYLTWNGPTNSPDPTANASVLVNGIIVTGTNIGFADSNCWGYDNSQAYFADVTGSVAAAGNGTYDLANFLKGI